MSSRYLKIPTIDSQSHGRHNNYNSHSIIIQCPSNSSLQQTCAHKKKNYLICNKEHHEDYVMTRMTNIEGKKARPQIWYETLNVAVVLL